MPISSGCLLKKIKRGRAFKVGKKQKRDLVFLLGTIAARGGLTRGASLLYAVPIIPCEEPSC